MRKRKGRGREGPGGVGAGTEAAAGVGRKMKKRKMEAKEVLRPFISLKQRKGGVRDHLGLVVFLVRVERGARLGAIEMVSCGSWAGRLVP